MRTVVCALRARPMIPRLAPWLYRDWSKLAPYSLCLLPARETSNWNDAVPSDVEAAVSRNAVNLQPSAR